MSIRSTLRRSGRFATVLAAVLLNAAAAGIATAAAPGGESSAKGIEQVWSLEGAWSGVTSDPSTGAIYAIDRKGKCVEVDTAGKQQREIKLPQGGGSTLRLASLPGNRAKILLAFTQWIGTLRAYDLNGTLLWTYPDGIDDVWADDLNGDGADEVIVGYNGSGGVHVLDGQGKLLWKSTAIANVWHVCAGDTLGQGKPQVVTTSAIGQVHVFDAGSGKRLKDVDAGCYATMVRVARAAKKGQADLLLVGGTPPGADDKEVLNALNLDGSKKWSLSLPSDPDSAQVAPGRPWLALGLRGGEVDVVDIDKGENIARVKNPAMAVEVGWVTKGLDAPLLLVASGGKLRAYRVAR
jgi:hypothetical protein